MGVGWQEIIALLLVMLVLGLALYRRWKKSRTKPDSSPSDAADAGPPREAPLRFYRRR